ncbi:MAG: HAD hydrolase family protein [Chitinophagales bacterium]|nr:HAD hydrolase family protein [Chitinophagales bacterium]MCZ2394328.1 HAD hydrolase family protein [Chitinophagales bacterium]
MEVDFIERLSLIQLIVLDVDGVLTNNDILCTEEGQFLRTMNIRDGYALRRALEEQLQIIIITGGNSLGVTKRLQVLGNIPVFSEIRDKLPVLKNFCKTHNILAENVLYMGDDILDMAPMAWSGVAVCPKDAVSEVIAISQYVSEFEGGKGCVREIVELILKNRNKWLNNKTI